MRLFASLREAAGTHELDVDGATVDDIVRALAEKFGGSFEELARSAAGLNGLRNPNPKASNAESPKKELSLSMECDHV